MAAYSGAIMKNPSLFNGAVVMDVGCGTGIGEIACSSLSFKISLTFMYFFSYIFHFCFLPMVNLSILLCLLMVSYPREFLFIFYHKFIHENFLIGAFFFFIDGIIISFVEG